MRLSSNTPKFYQEIEDQSIRVPPIEDGNTLGLNQGIIYTSEVENIIWTYFTNQSYTATISSNPTYLYSKDGSIYTILFNIQYELELYPGASNPGTYGSVLLKVGDLFNITGTGKDYIRGIVSSIGEITYTEDFNLYTYTVPVYATIMQGAPRSIANGDTFKWNRRLFQDVANQSVSTISNLSPSYNIATGELFLYWEEENPNALCHRISLRRNTNTNSPTIINAPGLKTNSTSTVRAFVNNLTGDISSIRITSNDIGIAFNRQVIIQGSGTGAKWATDIDVNGALLMNTYKITNATVGSNQINVSATKTTPATFNRTGGYMIPRTGTYVEGLTGISGTMHFYVGGITGATSNNRSFQIILNDAETGLPIVITESWKNLVIGKQIKTHDGVLRISSGTGYTGPSGVTASLKQLPNNVNWYWDPVYGSFAGTGQNWACAVASGYAGTATTTISGVKQFSQWSIEEYFNT